MDEAQHWFSSLNPNPKAAASFFSFFSLYIYIVLRFPFFEYIFHCPLHSPTLNRVPILIPTFVNCLLTEELLDLGYDDQRNYTVIPVWFIHCWRFSFHFWPIAIVPFFSLFYSVAEAKLLHFCKVTIRIYCLWWHLYSHGDASFMTSFNVDYGID